MEKLILKDMSWLWCHGCAQKGPFHKVGAAAENDLAPNKLPACAP